jgi:hypothetical protein
MKSASGLIFHDGMYARKWPLPLCVYSVNPRMALAQLYVHCAMLAPEIPKGIPRLNACADEEFCLNKRVTSQLTLYHLFWQEYFII